VVTREALIDYTGALSQDFPMLFHRGPARRGRLGWLHQGVQTIDRSIILGDDLIVTNRHRLERAVKTSAVDGFVMKPNQVGTSQRHWTASNTPRRTLF